jgi:hypothetical protein
VLYVTPYSVVEACFKSSSLVMHVLSIGLACIPASAARRRWKQLLPPPLTKIPVIPLPVMTYLLVFLTVLVMGWEDRMTNWLQYTLV